MAGKGAAPQVCREFSAKGQCRSGSTCRFVHARGSSWTPGAAARATQAPLQPSHDPPSHEISSNTSATISTALDPALGTSAAPGSSEPSHGTAASSSKAKKPRGTTWTPAARAPDHTTPVQAAPAAPAPAVHDTAAAIAALAQRPAVARPQAPQTMDAELAYLGKRYGNACKQLTQVWPALVRSRGVSARLTDEG